MSKGKGKGERRGRRLEVKEKKNGRKGNETKRTGTEPKGRMIKRRGKENEQRKEQR